MLFLEVDAFALQGLDDEVVDWPECVLWKRVGTQTILVAHHHQLEVCMLGDEGKVAENSLGED